MQSYETVAIVEKEGQLRVASVPFAPGTEVEVIVSPKRRPAEEFTTQWQRVCGEIRARAGNISDDEIQEEIDGHRAGA